MNSVLPPSVVERLQGERARIEAGAFTSSLGVGEMLLAREAGYQVLGQVMGAAVYQLGGRIVPAAWSASNRPHRGLRAEVTALSQTIALARELALERLSAEARLLGAQGVVGVKLRLRKTEVSAWKNQLLTSPFRFEVTMTGTAVRGGEIARKKPLFTSHLSGEETWKLERAGYAPCALVMGNCALVQILSNFMRSRFFLVRLQGKRGNFEVTQYTNALYAARKTALERLELDAYNSGARKVVGVQIEVETYSDIAELGWRGEIAKPFQIFSLCALGTAIRFLPRPENAPIQTILELP